MPTQTELVMQNGEFVHRSIVETHLGPQDHVIASLADNKRTILPIFNRVQGSKDDNAQYPMSAVISKEEIMLITELKFLPFKTSFARDQVGRYVPTFENADIGSVTMNDYFPVELLGGRIFFGVHCCFDTKAIEALKCYMALIFNDMKEGYHFWYPNHYDDGRVCMGRDWDQRTTPRFDNDDPSHMNGIMAHALRSFYGTSMNADLTSEITKQVFNKTCNGTWNTPPENNEGNRRNDTYRQLSSTPAVSLVLGATSHGI